MRGPAQKTILIKFSFSDFSVDVSSTISNHYKNIPSFKYSWSVLNDQLLAREADRIAMILEARREIRLYVLRARIHCNILDLHQNSY